MILLQDLFQVLVFPAWSATCSIILRPVSPKYYSVQNASCTFLSVLFRFLIIVVHLWSTKGFSNEWNFCLCGFGCSILLIWMTSFHFFLSSISLLVVFSSTKYNNFSSKTQILSMLILYVVVLHWNRLTKLC